MDLRSVNELSAITGNTLNIEEQCGLESSIVQRRLLEKLSGSTLFWGKIYGISQDYLVVVNINTENDFPQKTYYFCTNSDYNLRLLMHNKPEFESQASTMKSLLTGDPSYFEGAEDEPEVEPEPEDEEGEVKQKNQEPEKFREINRLSFIVRKIDHDCSLIPRGALFVDAKKNVKRDPSFYGLSFQTGTQHRGYMHFRKPESPQAISLLKQPGIVTSTDFLDSIDKDFPKDMWLINMSEAGDVAQVRNLYWEGYGFYCSIEETSRGYGGSYFGNGIPNENIIYML